VDSVDNNTLHINEKSNSLIKDTPNQVNEKSNHATQTNQPDASKKHQYSRKEVSDLMNYMNQKFMSDSNREVIDNIAWFAQMENPHRIEVALLDTSAQAIRLFKKEFCDSPILHFRKGSPFVDQDNLK
jgi:hypothetical protein